jgi:4-amino-4-deoxychorismate lyase
LGLHSEPDLEMMINIPESAASDLYKCRIEYDTAIRKVEFFPYIIKPVKSLSIIEDDNINYSYKFAGRDEIQRLMERRGDCDDILIIKKGMVTDSSYANVVFREKNGKWVTPSTYILPGTRRAALIMQGLITEAKISYRDIDKYSEFKLINAMIDIDDTEGIPVSNLI